MGKNKVNKITFFSNYLSPHQLPFCNAMSNIPGIQYTFVATTPFNQERASLGYKDINIEYPFVVRSYEDEASNRKALELSDSSDVVIIGSAPDTFMEQRLKNGKITYKYSERLYKQGLSIMQYPRAIISAWLHHGRFQKKPLYMLCASAFTAADCAKFGNYIGKTYQWGYFPEITKLNEEELFMKKHTDNKVSILWAGRLIRWKHPDASILVADRLKKRGYSFDLNIIGNGELEQELKNLIDSLNLNDCVHMLGSMSPEQVQKHMEESDIFLFTSDFNEGWGAVLNESMSNGCAIVASHAIGSVPFLVKNKENGLIYHSGNIDQLYECVESLLMNPAFRQSIGKKAYQTISLTWNAKVAAERLIVLSEKLMASSNQCLRFSDGPCSVAPIIKDEWFLKC